jgi:SAM-dependent methyltransferase
MRVLDVGCGPGGLTRELARRVGTENVAAIDPAPQFVQACRDRNPGADVRDGVAEDLPWDDGTFDATLSSLVIAFMSDPDQGVREMVRVTKPGGRVAACMWDIKTGGMTMLRILWDAVREVEPGAGGENALPGTAEGDILRRFERAGVTDIASGALTAHADYTGFDYSTLKNVTINQCQAACLGDNKCAAFTYNPKATWCFMKSDFGALSSSAGAIAGRVVTVAAPSLSPKVSRE